MSLDKELRHLPLFAKLPEALLAEVLAPENSHVKKFAGQSMIHQAGDPCRNLEVILSGTVIVQNLDLHGTAVTVATFGKGETLGSNLLFSRRRPFYPMIVSAKSDVSLLSFSGEIILKVCREDSTFLLNFLAEISDKSQVLTGKIAVLAQKSLREKIWDYLRQEAQNQGNSDLTLPISKKEWAELLGVERPSLSRELSKMRQEKLITFKNRQIKLLDSDK